MSLPSSDFRKRTITWIVLIIAAIGLYLTGSAKIISYAIFFLWFNAWLELKSLQSKTGEIIILVTTWIIQLLWLAHHQIKLVAFIYSLAVFHDTAGYLVGSWIGKHKMAPTVSPGKTWEGFGASIIAVIIGIFVWHKLCCPQFLLSWLCSLKIIFFGLLCATISLLGDLHVSLLKRKTGVKDTGTLLPGHGGVLDRLDSIIPLIWLAWIFESYIKQLLCLPLL